MKRVVDDTLEDLEFLDSAGIGAIDAARRADFPSVVALEKWLERKGHYPLFLRLKARDPEGIHHQRKACPVTETVDTLAALLARAEASSSKRIVAKAERARDLLDEIERALRAEAEDEKRKAAALADIAKLERQLAEAKARLRGTPAPSVITASEVRAWAAGAGIECPTMGRIPTAVLDAYRQREEAA